MCKLRFNQKFENSQTVRNYHQLKTEHIHKEAYEKSTTKERGS